MTHRRRSRSPADALGTGVRPHLTAPRESVRPQKQRVIWYALGLLVLAPFVAETVASANTPFVLFPIVLPLFAVVYGCPALLARELWIRRRLSAWRLILLGIGYTAFNEGVIAATWFRLSASGRVLAFTAGQAGHALGVNWAVAVNLVVFHTVYSLIVPIVLIQAVASARSPSAASRPWLGRTGAIVAAGLVALVLLGSLTTKASDRACGASSHASCLAGRTTSALLVVLVAGSLVLLPAAAHASRTWSVRLDRTGRPTLVLAGVCFAVAFLVSFFALPLLDLPWPSLAGGAVLLAVVWLAISRSAPALRFEPRPATLLCLGLLIPGMVLSARFVLVAQPVAAVMALAGLIGLLRRLPR